MDYRGILSIGGALGVLSLIVPPHASLSNILSAVLVGICVGFLFCDWLYRNQEE